MTGDTLRNCDIPIRSSIQILGSKPWIKVVKNLGLKLSIASLSLSLMGCGSPSDSNPISPSLLPEPTNTDQPSGTNSTTKSPPTLQTKPKPPEELAQYLPITATAAIAGREIQLEVAETPKQQEKGLMFRPPLADDRGMLFPFIPARPVAFWMKNTPSPLDIIFLLDGKVQAIAANATMCKSDPCPIYPENGVVADMVIEVRAGLTQELGLKEGDEINIKFLLPKNQ